MRRVTAGNGAPIMRGWKPEKIFLRTKKIRAAGNGAPIMRGWKLEEHVFRLLVMQAGNGAPIMRGWKPGNGHLQVVHCLLPPAMEPR